jgi:hypothetical protein
MPVTSAAPASRYARRQKAPCGSCQRMEGNIEMATNLIVALSSAVVSLACVGTAAYMAWHERKGWGWFLFVGFLVAGACLSDVSTAMPK